MTEQPEINISDNMPPQELAANRLHEALESGRLQPVRAALHALHPAEVADLLEAMPPANRKIVWSVIDDSDRGEILLEVHDELRDQFLQRMDEAEIVAATEGLEIDDLADFIEDLPKQLADQILLSMDLQNRQRVEAVLSYGPDTAGGLMNLDAVTIRPDVSVDVVLRYLRKRGELPSHTDKLFVVDRYGRYVGWLLTRVLLTQPTETQVVQLMEEDETPIMVDLADRDVAKLFENRDLISAAVVDENHRLLGRITIDDVVDVIIDEADHNMMSMAGLDEEEDMFAPVTASARRRAVWLGINLLTAFIAARVVGAFEATIDQVVALAVLMPVVASMGGIGGSQTLTLMIRGMALGQIGGSNALYLLRKELSVALINGLLWAGVVSVIVLFWFESPELSLVIAMALVINQVTAALAGVALPLGLKKMGIDPALAGSVVLTTVTDVIGFLAFLGLGAIILL